MKRVIFCSGQVYAALFKHRETHDLKDTAITRVEELHPFPWEEVRQNLDAYPNAEDIVWCQEETLNGGSWSHVMPHIDLILQKTKSHGDKKVRFAGRDPASGVAVGYKVLHALQEQMLLNDAFQIEWLLSYDCFSFTDIELEFASWQLPVYSCPKKMEFVESFSSIHVQDV